MICDRLLSCFRDLEPQHSTRMCVFFSEVANFQRFLHLRSGGREWFATFVDVVCTSMHSCRPAG